ncbi:excalibur calcium-binding domain-containing protein [Streptomyces sp. NBC_00663]|uniref:excalibur calcium-binding domain-containing protein n=1 Tax=Streptomyces sp. NBC_00663 TaxID=2975801 RepID=UPI002E2FE4DF|nr:excalibur calcium-binding domain-containing protein [Streptomyces sp. NBC_00663]
MKLLRKPGAIVVAALALAVLPAAASAHDGDHPFDNCTEAYAAGYANIAKGDEHYGTHLDRDGDGVGCDRPPAGFIPAGDDKAAGTDTQVKTGEKQAASDDLAETGGGDTTPYLAAGSVVALLAGSGVLLLTRRRRAPAGRP